VRDRINISAAEAPDNVVTQFIADAAETIALETGLVIKPIKLQRPRSCRHPQLGGNLLCSLGHCWFGFGAEF
jgi:hypothetical protein